MKKAFTVTRIRTRDSQSYPGEPTEVWLDNHWECIEEIVDRWYEGSMDPSVRMVLYYKVRTSRGFLLLRYLDYFDCWQYKLL